MTSEIEEYLSLLKKLTGATSDTDLATKLGKAKQTVSSWRRRGSIPLEVQYELAEQYGPEATPFPEIKYAVQMRERLIATTVFLSLFDEQRAELEPKDDPSRYVSWGRLFEHVELELMKAARKVREASLDGDPFAAAELVKGLLRAGKLPDVQRSIDIWIRDVEVDD
ncbi:hypothetical protein ASD04_17785 [Devosia sp. Root436]|uniref:helix-turn-helix domain-containing protein n=1 Tax=Devosia sp. Root436 TaxID=1736537 RepID=UPI0006F4D250|nr:helix-turn-helix domain-containing protein [Devosia sp. Root436]KQX34092.1 hypothetical protein ASD04_17785 [Devosia sp. Root436]